jgi:hypothetical protein
LASVAILVAGKLRSTHTAPVRQAHDPVLLQQP